MFMVAEIFKLKNPSYLVFLMKLNLSVFVEETGWRFSLFYRTCHHGVIIVVSIVLLTDGGLFKILPTKMITINIKCEGSV